MSNKPFNVIQGKRILIFSTSYFPFVGGAEVAVKEITDRISDTQFDLITARLKRDLPKTERIGNVNMYRLGFGIPIVDKLLLPFYGALRAMYLNKKNHYDYFWCIMVTFASGAAFLSNWFQKKVPIILTLQEGDSESHLRFRWGGLINLSWKLALRRVRMLTVISTYLGDRAKKLGYNGPIEVIPNGVDVKNFQCFVSPSKEKNQTLLVTTGRLVKKNAVEDIICALPLLPHEVKLSIIGVGELEAKLKRLVKAKNLSDRVEFLGFVDYKHIPSYLCSADIFIRPSLSEGMGNSFIEAMAAGLPVIATPVGGITDFLFDPERDPHKPPTGLFVNVHDPKDIARQVERLIKSKNLRDTLVANSKRLVTEKYDWKLIAEQIKKRVFDK